jgi:isopenicillin N synthase-like dioxygenase
LLALVIDLHRPVAIDLGVDERFFAPAFERAITIQRLLYYPPHPGAFDGTLHGAAPHTDYGNLTLLAQDDAGGLELQMRDGTWIDVAPTPGAFVCNIGDCLMRWSNDVYVSNRHRVVNRSGRGRYSVAFFGDPAADALVACLPSCTDDAHPPKYEPILYGTYLQRRLAAAYPLSHT